jgi:hypothetical protein
MSTKYSKCSQNRPIGHKTYQHLPLQDPPKFAQIGIFGLKICHLATLAKITSYVHETFQIKSWTWSQEIFATEMK